MKEKLFDVAFTTDLLIFGIDSRDNENSRSLPKKYFSILLVKRTKEPFLGKWCLPGGFVNMDETSFEAAGRVLLKETGLKDVYMQQLKVNDNVGRDPRGRVISVSYMAVIDRTLLKDEPIDGACWFDIDVSVDDNIVHLDLCNGDEIIKCNVKKDLIDLKTDEYNYNKLDECKLAFDHDEILTQGIMELRNKVNKTDIVFNLMPDLFTIGELKQVYELLLGKKLINSVFRRTIAEKVILTDKMVKTGGHRPSVLCKYNDERE